MQGRVLRVGQHRRGAPHAGHPGPECRQCAPGHGVEGAACRSAPGGFRGALRAPQQRGQLARNAGRGRGDSAVFEGKPRPGGPGGYAEEARVRRTAHDRLVQRGQQRHGPAHRHTHGRACPACARRTRFLRLRGQWPLRADRHETRSARRVRRRVPQPPQIRGGARHAGVAVFPAAPVPATDAHDCRGGHRKVREPHRAGLPGRHRSAGGCRDARHSGEDQDGPGLQGEGTTGREESDGAGARTVPAGADPTASATSCAPAG